MRGGSVSARAHSGEPLARELTCTGDADETIYYSVRVMDGQTLGSVKILLKFEIGRAGLCVRLGGPASNPQAGTVDVGLRWHDRAGFSMLS